MALISLASVRKSGLYKIGPYYILSKAEVPNCILTQNNSFIVKMWAPKLNTILKLLFALWRTLLLFIKLWVNQLLMLSNIKQTKKTWLKLFHILA